MDALKKSLDEMKESFQNRMKQFQTDLQLGNSGSASSPNGLASDFAVFRSFVLSSLECLQSQMNLLASLTDQVETRSRRKIVLVHGVPEATKEDTASLVINTLLKHISIPELVPETVSQCHRLGPTRSNKPRPILVKCRDLSTKTKLWQNKKVLKGTGITVSEFLTKPRHDAFMSARTKFGIHKCWTRDGTVYVLDSAGERHKVSSVADVDAIPGSDPACTDSSSTGETVPKQRPKRVLRNK
ncbi:unnamed protein product [Leptosia nina]|uniref:Uncharacterized protein n=1 Tax=Leptosia nina TaxID=320188 RepID=A0AAV1JWT5_9NEOP